MSAAADRSGLGFPLIGVSIAVFRGPRVLLASRTKPPFKGAFSLPGGLVEWGESLFEAALRELDEEVQVKAKIIGFNRHVEMIEMGEGGKIKTHYIVASFTGEWISGDGTPGPEAAEILWADPFAVGSLVCTPDLGSIVQAAARMMEFEAPSR